MKLILFFNMLIFASLTIAGDHDAMVERINKKYFSMEREGVQSFSCKLSNSLLDELIPQLKDTLGEDSPTYKSLVNMDREMFFDKGEVELKFSKVENPANNKGLDQMIEGTRQMYSGFFDFWLGSMYEPLISAEDVDSLTVDETGDGYQIHIPENEEDGRVTLHLDHQLIIQGIDIKFGSNNTFLKPSFRETDKGLVVESCNININNAMLVTNLKIDYNEVEGIPMPAKAYFKSEMPGMTQEFTLGFSEYKLTR